MGTYKATCICVLILGFISIRAQSFLQTQARNYQNQTYQLNGTSVDGRLIGSARHNVNNASDEQSKPTQRYLVRGG